MLKQPINYNPNNENKRRRSSNISKSNKITSFSNENQNRISSNSQNSNINKKNKTAVKTKQLSQTKHKPYNDNKSPKISFVSGMFYRKVESSLTSLFKKYVLRECSWDARSNIFLLKNKENKNKLNMTLKNFFPHVDKEELTSKANNLGKININNGLNKEIQDNKGEFNFGFKLIGKENKSICLYTNKEDDYQSWIKVLSIYFNNYDLDDNKSKVKERKLFNSNLIYSKEEEEKFNFKNQEEERLRREKKERDLNLLKRKLEDEERKKKLKDDNILKNIRLEGLIQPGKKETVEKTILKHIGKESIEVKIENNINKNYNHKKKNFQKLLVDNDLYDNKKYKDRLKELKYKESINILEEERRKDIREIENNYDAKNQSSDNDEIVYVNLKDREYEEKKENSNIKRPVNFVIEKNTTVLNEKEINNKVNINKVNKEYLKKEIEKDNRISNKQVNKAKEEKHIEFDFQAPTSYVKEKSNTNININNSIKKIGENKYEVIDCEEEERNYKKKISSFPSLNIVKKYKDIEFKESHNEVKFKKRIIIEPLYDMNQNKNKANLVKVINNFNYTKETKSMNEIIEDKNKVNNEIVYNEKELKETDLKQIDQNRYLIDDKGVIKENISCLENVLNSSNKKTIVISEDKEIKKRFILRADEDNEEDWFN